MKIYYTCEYCNQVYAVTSVDGVEGAVEIKGICDDCAMEIGLIGKSSMASHRIHYN
ncbi:MAG: hypothetical protein ACOXZ5_06880 [Syntrophomonadaceae bacterium]|jgi:hypothetical protein